MKKYHFQNTVHIQTDRVGKFRDSWISVGLQSYPENKEKHIEGYEYFSYDEVKQLIEDGKTSENVYLSEEGEVKMNSWHLSAITAFSVVNGIAFLPKNNRDLQGLLSYAKRKGYVVDTPVPVEMMVGVKNLETAINDTYILSYTFLPKKLGLVDEEKVQNVNADFVKRLMIGTVKRLEARYYITHKDGEEIRLPRCEINGWAYDEKTATISIITTRKGIVSDELRETIKQLDLQLYYFFNQEFDWFQHLDALKQCARDYHNAHWINEEDKDDNNHFKWYEK